MDQRLKGARPPLGPPGLPSGSTSSKRNPPRASYAYDGRGYSDPRAEDVAQRLHGMTVDLQREAMQRRLAQRQEEGIGEEPPIVVP